MAKVKRNVSLNKKRKSARKIAREEGWDHTTVGQVIRKGTGSCINGCTKFKDTLRLTGSKLTSLTNHVAYSRTRKCSIWTVRSTDRTTECMPRVDSTDWRLTLPFSRTVRTVIRLIFPWQPLKNLCFQLYHPINGQQTHQTLIHWTICFGMKGRNASRVRNSLHEKQPS